MPKSSKIALCTLLLLILVAGSVSPARAFDGRGGERVSVGADEVVDDDLYVGANEFVLDGTVNGDVVAGGTMLTINGIVNGNLIAGGQTIVINGSITGDVIAGGSVLLFGESAHIGGDVVSAGYSLEFRKGSVIGRDAVLGAAQIILASNVARNVKAGTAALELDGNVGGDVFAAVGEASQAQAGPLPTDYMPQTTIPVPVVRQGLTIDPAARIAGDLQYTQNADLAFPAGVILGSVSRQPQPEDSSGKPAELSLAAKFEAWALQSLRNMIALLLVALLLLRIAPRFVAAISSQLRTRTWSSLGWGFFSWAAFIFLALVVLFAMVAATVFFHALTLGQLSAAVAWLGLLLLFGLILGFVLATAYLAKIVFGTVLGTWLLRKLNSPLSENRYWPTLLGILFTWLIIAALSMPIVPGLLGWLTNSMVVLLGLGATWLWLWQRLPKPLPATT